MWLYRCSLLLWALSFFGPWISLGNAQSDALAPPWDELRTTAEQIKQNLADGDARSAHMRVILMGLLLGRASQAPEVAEKIALMESRRIPEDDDRTMARFIPAVNDLLQAIDQADLAAVSNDILQLTKNTGDARVEHARQVSANLAGAARGTALYNLRGSLEHALFVNDPASEVEVATQMQGMISDLLSRHERIQEYAFTHFMINDALGRAAFQRGDYQAASEYLQRAAEMPFGAKDFATRLDGFGPNTWLAAQLLRVGKRGAVLKFLQTCKHSFWLSGNEKADPWIAAIQSGKPSDLRPNADVTYGYLERYAQ